MPAVPSPIRTQNTNKTNGLRKAPETIQAYGTKYRQNIKMVFTTISVLAWRLIPLDLKYSFTRFVTVAKKSGFVVANLNVWCSAMISFFLVALYRMQS